MIIGETFKIRKSHETSHVKMADIDILITFQRYYSKRIIPEVQILKGSFQHEQSRLCTF